MKTETAYKIYTDEQEYLNSPELTKIFEGYENTEKKYFNKWSTFLKALVVKDDRYAKYGINFKIYRVSRLNSSNMLVIKEVGLGSTLTSAPMQVVEIEGNSITFTDQHIEKTDEGRAYAANNDLLVS